MSHCHGLIVKEQNHNKIIRDSRLMFEQTFKNIGSVNSDTYQ